MSDIFERLKAPFPPDRISWRVGSTTQDKKKGLAFGYIDARDVMERLDEVCGPGNWQNRYSHTAGKTVCDIGVKCGDEWIWKADGSGDTDVEAEKGALSDAFKRAAVRWGIGRYLYDIPATWVEIEPAGRSFKIKESEFARLNGVLGRNGPAPAREPAPKQAPKLAAVPQAAGWKPSPEAQDFVDKMKLCKTRNAFKNFMMTIAADVKKMDEANSAFVRSQAEYQQAALREQDTSVLAAG